MDFSDGLLIIESPCPPGNTLNGDVCVDINACEEVGVFFRDPSEEVLPFLLFQVPCPENSDCEDIKGGQADATGRKCTCHPGFFKNSVDCASKRNLF